LPDVIYYISGQSLKIIKIIATKIFMVTNLSIACTPSWQGTQNYGQKLEWQYTSVLPTVERLRQEDGKPGLYSKTLFQKTQTNKQIKKLDF
jgi:hypothetical protein